MDLNLPFSEDVAYRFDSLYQWLNRKYTIEHVDHEIAGASFRFFKIANIDEVLDTVVEELPETDENIPYWAELWPSALALAQYISRIDLKNVSALEIGCGLGLVGVVAGANGAEVILSDIQEDALRMTELNWIVNFHEIPPTVKLDWRQPPKDQKYPVILASDVAYERDLFYPLIHTFRQLLKPDGKIYLSEPNRTVGKEFFELLDKEGFQRKPTTESVYYRERESYICVYEIERVS